MATAVYSGSIPASNHTLATDQPLMLGNTQYVQQSYGKDHNFTSASDTTITQNDGYHTVIHQQNAPGNADPVNIAITGQTYVKTITLGGNADQALFFESGGGRITQLTGFSGFANQFNLTPNNGFAGVGPLFFAWGIVTPAVATHDTGIVTFTQQFATACVGIQATFIASSIAQGSSNNTVSVVPIDKASFNWVVNLNTAGTYPQFYWLAYGY